MKEGICYYNGSICGYDDVRIPLSDRSIYFAEAVYDVAIGEGGRVYQLHEHLSRLLSNATILKLPHPDENELIAIIRELLKKFGGAPFQLYLQISGYGECRLHHGRSGERSNLLITVTPREKTDIGPVSLRTEEDNRHSICNIKTTNLLCAVRSACEASVFGFDETMYLRNGIPTECSHSNFVTVRDGRVYSYPDSPYILSGITRNNVERICRNAGIPFCKEALPLPLVTSSDAVIILSTTKLGRRAYAIDEKQLNTDDCDIADLIIDGLRQDYLLSMCKINDEI